MEPHHHVHISTGFAFVVALFLVAIVALIVWAIVATRRPKVIVRHQVHSDGSASVTYSPRRPSPWNYPQPQSSAPVVVNAGSNNDMLTGLMLGEMMSRPSVIEERTVIEPAYEDRTAYDSGFSYDDGPSVSDGGSFGGDAGGFDVSW